MTSLETLAERAKVARERLAAWEERYHASEPLCHGMLQISAPKRTRGRSLDALTKEHLDLSAAWKLAESRLRLAQARAEAPARKMAAQAAHATIDLKAMHEGKTEVQWTLNGGWLKVIRWNRKSVTVDMAGERDTIPHTQVGGAR